MDLLSEVSSESKKMIKVRILRFNPAISEEPFYHGYEVPFVESLTVLMSLNYIYENIDSSLAYYYSCRTGKCGGCTVMVSGKAVQACATIVKGDITVEPLSGYKVIKDLVVDFEERKSRQ